jgi:hypothetical protein
MRKTVLLVILFLGMGAVQAATLARLSTVREEAEALAGAVKRLRAQLADAAPAAKPEGSGVSARVESLERRLARLEPAAAAPRAPAAAVAGLAATALAAATPQKVEEMVSSSLKKVREERRAAWMQKADEQFQRGLTRFAKDQKLGPAQVEQSSALLKDDREQRREIQRQLREGALEPADARRQLQELRGATETRLKEALGDKAYEAYEEWRDEQRRERRRVWRSLQAF